MVQILLVDDESYVTESLAATIPWESLGIERVHQAASALAAVDVLEAHDIDILVTDIRMPGMTGLELIVEVNERWPHIRSLLLTGYADFEYAKKALQLKAFDYILKPVDDDEFIKCVSAAMDSIKEEWEAFDKVHQLQYSRRNDFGVLRTHLMHDLLLGRDLTVQKITDKMSEYEIKLRTEHPASMLLIQLGKHFSDMDYHSVSLIEYAIGNIAEEVFAPDFHVWHCKAPHDCLIVLIEGNWDLFAERTVDEQNHFLRAAIETFRKNVSNYLKGEIYVTLTNWFHFPDELPKLYQTAIRSLYWNQQEETNPLLFIEEQTEQSHSSVKSLEGLYTHPTLTHLLESRQWEEAEAKVSRVFGKMEEAGYTREHLYELFISVTSAFMYTAHKQGRFITQMDQIGFDPLHAQKLVHSFPHLKEWIFSMMNKLKAEWSASEQSAKSYVVKQVQELIAQDKGQELSVKTIADQVYLHPVYLSKIYKAETGEGLGDYIIRMRMERALYLLKYSNKKIYEITTELGYQNPQYFSKMFKKHYGMTPHEFRDQ
ncbi:response regulator transcription factor [Paenibacillus polymyxa]|uniref:Chemotaxis protein CheY n=1 Tax=Paenibacillus polymyxa TaxID=1406 RepID=A0A378Y0N4_PAEPO|nr:response regulator [Paenibacillus polymyxa]MBE7896674.1 response regulator [Paenibacillus polymyxa]MBG9765425.1 chemotaxis protein CheY [Paenibacillus polymyxa]MCC3257202.1 response regulator [Paenibacillus polymyxa]NMP10974.1 response regulator [Paenibacillus polymyxa]QPK54344.1 response regulator [Paenibacillus polymyxa]